MVSAVASRRSLRRQHRLLELAAAGARSCGLGQLTLHRCDSGAARGRRCGLGAGDERAQVLETARAVPRAREPAPARCRARWPRPGRRARAGRAGRRAAGTAGRSGRRRRRRGRGVRRGRTAAAARSTAVAKPAARLATMLRTSADPAVRQSVRRARGTSRRSGPACRRAGRNRGSCTSNDHLRARRTPPPASSSVDRSSVTPRPQRLREQPGAHHVGEEPDPAVDAALVGEVGGAGLVGEHRTVELDADQPPGAAGDVRRVGVGHRHADHRRRGVVRADRDHRRARRDSPTTVPGVDQLGQLARARAPTSGQQLGVPLAGVHVEQPGGRGVGALAHGPAGEPVRHQVRDEQQLLRLGQPRARPRAGRWC